MQKKTMLLLLLVIIFIAMPITAYAEGKDYEGHWAESTIKGWVDKGYITGYPDGSFRPEGQVTRAEFVKLANKLYGYTEISEVTFEDVKQNDWYYAEVQKSLASGYIKGISENIFAPNDCLTREQAAVIAAKITGLEIKSENAQDFADNSQISGWAKDYVNAAANAQLLIGYSEDKTFKPQNHITRAEAVVLLDRMSKTTKYDLTVTEPGTIIENKTYENVHISKTVGNGNVTLKNVKITGELLVEGGGENSVIIQDSTINKLIIDKEDGKLRILLQGKTEVDLTSILSGVKLEQQDLTGSGFNSVIIDENAQSSDVVTISANINKLTFNASIRINIRTGVIESLVINGAPEGFSIYLGEDTTIQSLTVNSGISFTGGGTIENVQVNSNGVTFEKEPEKMTVLPGISKPEIIPPALGGGGGGGGPVSPELLNIEASVVNAVVTTALDEEFDLLSNIHVTTSEVNITFVLDDLDETYVTLTGGMLTGKAQGIVNVTAKLSKSGYADKNISFKVAVAPVVLNWTNPSGNKIEGATETININLSLLAGVSNVDDVTVVMLWEKKDAAEFKYINSSDITIKNAENNEILNEDGIYRIGEGMDVKGNINIATSATFNNSGEYKLTVYVIKE
jgi:hypothetical protein